MQDVSASKARICEKVRGGALSLPVRDQRDGGDAEQKPEKSVTHHEPDLRVCVPILSLRLANPKEESLSLAMERMHDGKV